jgi:hypothetical protein
MRVSAHLLPAFVTLAVFSVSASAQNTNQHGLSPKILSAKSVYFDNQTDVPAVGEKALERLKKWGRFRIVNDKKQADFILQLSASPYNGGHLLLADGQTATIHHDGDVEVDPVPTYNKAAPVRVAYLTAIDPTTGVRLWSDSHVWGGLLTGFNSAGERLINVFRKQLEK